MRVIQFGLHLGDPAIGGQELLDVVMVEPQLSGTRCQDFGGAHVIAVGEVRLHQPLLHGRLSDRRAGLARKPDHPVSEQRVGAKRLIHVEGDAVLGSGVRDMTEDLIGAFRAAKLLGIGLADRRGDPRCRSRVKLVGVIRDVEIDAEVVVDLSETRFESALADVTPRAHNIREDVDRDRWSGESSGARFHEGHVTPLTSLGNGRQELR
mgnify:CR=1 FL=1